MWLLRRLPLRGWTDAEFHKVILVQPREIVDYQDIKRWSHPRLTAYRPSSGVGARQFVRLNAGKVLDGDWDRVRMPFEENDVYRLLHERFALGRQWEEIELFQEYVREVRAGRTVLWRHSSTYQQLMAQAREVESLYRDIRDEGYRSGTSRSTSDEVTVSIGRNGELLYNNVGGHHRLSIAKLLGVECIPVRVLLRHREWQDVRNRVRMTRTRSSAELPGSFLGHPDLQDLLQLQVK